MASGVSVGARISDQYRHGLSRVFERFPNASKAILLEEDLIVAPDFFRYVRTHFFISYALL